MRPPQSRRSLRQNNQIFEFVKYLAVTLLTVSSYVPAAAQVSSVKTVFIIAMSGQSWSSIKDSINDPYLKQALVTYSHAENYHSMEGASSAESQYLALESGEVLARDVLQPAEADRQISKDHLVRRLTDMGISWKTYQEGILDGSCPLQSAGLYDSKLNQFVHFDDVTDGFNPQSPTCNSHVRPYSELASDIQSNRVARYNFIKPNICHSMSQSCPIAGDHIKQGDDWLASEVPKILASSAYQSGGVLLIVWDQAGADVPIGLIVLSPFAKHGYANLVRYSHGSTLRTVQEIFGIDAKPLGVAANEQSLDDFFGSAKADGGALALSWSATPGARTYSVKRALAKSGPYTTLATGLDTTSYVDRSAAFGVDYFYVVSASNIAGEGPDSGQASGRAITLPPAPTNLAVTSVP